MPQEFVDAMAQTAGMLAESLTYAVLLAIPVLICAWLFLRGLSHRRALRDLPVQRYRFVTGSSAFVALGVLAHVVLPSVYKPVAVFATVFSLLAMLPLASSVAYLGARVVSRRRANANAAVARSRPDVIR